MGTSAAMGTSLGYDASVPLILEADAAKFINSIENAVASPAPTSGRQMGDFDDMEFMVMPGTDDASDDPAPQPTAGHSPESR